jgi:hypothetical protein
VDDALAGIGEKARYGGLGYAELARDVGRAHQPVSGQEGFEAWPAGLIHASIE